MNREASILLVAVALAAPTAAAAQADAPTGGLRAGTDLAYSSDSDGTEQIVAGIDLDAARRDDTHYVGIRLEKAWFEPAGSDRQVRERGYVRVARPFGAWQARAAIGTDGRTLIGSMSVNDNAPFRKELFVERDVVETRQGLDRGIYQTFLGAALDVPVDGRNMFNVLLGLQSFTGRNERLHLRGSYVHVLAPRLGLSAQVRSRYFRSSEPGEFDYYSPRWHAEVLPVVQIRKFLKQWEVLAAGGIGLQRDAGADWRQLRYANLRVRKAIEGTGWGVIGSFTYTNSPADTRADGAGYSYRQFRLGISRQF